MMTPTAIKPPLNHEKWLENVAKYLPKEQARAAAACPMSGHTVEIREYLANHGPSTPERIGRHLRMEPHAVTQYLHRLEKYSAVRCLARHRTGPYGHGGVYALRCHKMRDF